MSKVYVQSKIFVYRKSLFILLSSFAIFMFVPTLSSTPLYLIYFKPNVNGKCNWKSTVRKAFNILCLACGHGLHYGFVQRMI